MRRQDTPRRPRRRPVEDGRRPQPAPSPPMLRRARRRAGHRRPDARPRHALPRRRPGGARREPRHPRASTCCSPPAARCARDGWREAVDAGGRRPAGRPLPRGQRPDRRAARWSCATWARCTTRRSSPSARAATPARFRYGAAHWIGPVRPVPVAAVERETLRRRELLHRIWPDAGDGHRPARPGRAAPCDAAVPPASARVLDQVDGVRTAADIALALGRPAFHTLVDLRRLAAAGLVEAVRAQPPARQPPRRPAGSRSPRSRPTPTSPCCAGSETHWRPCDTRARQRAERRQLMAAEAEVLDELHRLRARSPADRRARGQRRRSRPRPGHPGRRARGRRRAHRRRARRRPAADGRHRPGRLPRTAGPRRARLCRHVRGGLLRRPDPAGRGPGQRRPAAPGGPPLRHPDRRTGRRRAGAPAQPGSPAPHRRARRHRTRPAPHVPPPPAPHASTRTPHPRRPRQTRTPVTTTGNGKETSTPWPTPKPH